MEGGIPSSLLEGLGFTESESATEANIATDDVDGDDDDDGAHLDAYASMMGCSASSLLGPEGLPPARSSYLVDQIHALAKSGILVQQMVDRTSPVSSSQMSSGFNNEPVISSTAPMRTSQRLSVKSSPSAETTTEDNSSNVALMGRTCIVTTPGLRPEASKTIPTFPSAAGHQSIAASASELHRFLPRTARFCDSTPKTTVMKGNIVYERMPTGEVVASLVRTPPTDDSSARLHQGTISSSSSSSNRMLPSSFQGAQSTGFAAVHLDDCPINEYNVGEVLEKSIKAMQSMRMLLTSLRDDLRRIGAGNAMVTDEQVRKRQEVADKLTKAYMTYKRSIEDIESQPLLENAHGTGQTAAAVVRGVQNPSEVTRPAVFARNDAAIRSNAQTRPRQNNVESNVKLDRGKLPGHDREVIELSGSDEESAPRSTTVVRQVM